MFEVAIDDLRRDFKGNAVMYKNRPVYIEDVAKDGTVRYLDLYTQRSKYAPFSLKDFTVASRRLGFINSMGSVIYAARIPMRKYYMGLCRHNVKMYGISVLYPHGKGETQHRLNSFMVPEIADALLNKYPTLEECVDQLKGFEGARAFDKQFAIDEMGGVFYKTKCVGQLPKNARKTADSIQWRKGSEYLIQLLDNNHTKTVRSMQ
jgi:hypothetical protein